MFNRILVANRGEIAIRVIRACRDLGIESVAVYSEADRDSLHVRLADEAICIGPAAGAQSYLNIARIISAAEVADVDAIHPGYGFLSENAHFASVCRDSQIAFIGPSPESMEALGAKIRAREIAKAAGAPLLPGSDGPVLDEAQAKRVAHAVGYPVMIKASAGGGGRGIRFAHNDLTLANALLAAKTEATAAFKDGTVYIEKMIERPRHVEVQILGDQHGSLIHLGERDCSTQRRHQKLLEESPSPVLSEGQRKDLCEAALKVARAAKYHNAGTVEFLLDPGTGKFYFMEVNTRLQVEHPVTEAVSGFDLVKAQIRIAAGERLDKMPRRKSNEGHAVEVRINAEDPANGFRTTPGRLASFIVPGGPGVRVDTHGYAGYDIPSNYDSLLAKLIVHGRDRTEALAVLSRALRDFIVEGVPTTIPFFRGLLEDERFLAGRVDTGFVEREFLAQRRGAAS